MSYKQFYVEKQLPSKFIYQLGIYLQTCAHIELASCALITCLEGKTPSETGWLQHYSAARKLNTTKLIERLANASAKAEKHGFSKELQDLSEWIDRYVDRRHIAAHGAFFRSPNGFLRVDRVKNQGDKKSPDFVQNRTAITEALVNEAIEDADRIYLALRSMLERIQPGLVNEVHNQIVPIVEHPQE